MGTPLATLMLERCAQTIEQVIAPNVTGVFPSAQAGAIARVLRILATAVQDKSRELAEENEGMKEALGRVLEVLRREKTLSRNAVRNRLIKRLDHELKRDEAERPTVGEENYDLKGALVETINGLEALTDELSIETISSLRQQIRPILRQQLNHSLAGSDLLVGRK